MNLNDQRELYIDLIKDNYEMRVLKLLEFKIPPEVSNENDQIIDELKEEINTAKSNYKENEADAKQKINDTEQLESEINKHFNKYIDEVKSLGNKYIDGKMKPCKRTLQSLQSILWKGNNEDTITCDLRKYDYYVKLSELWNEETFFYDNVYDIDGNMKKIVPDILNRKNERIPFESYSRLLNTAKTLRVKNKNGKDQFGVRNVFIENKIDKHSGYLRNHKQLKDDRNLKQRIDGNPNIRNNNYYRPKGDYHNKERNEPWFTPIVPAEKVEGGKKATKRTIKKTRTKKSVKKTRTKKSVKKTRSKKTKIRSTQKRNRKK